MFQGGKIGRQCLKRLGLLRNTVKEKRTKEGILYQVFYNDDKTQQYVRINGVDTDTDVISIPFEIDGIHVEVIKKAAFLDNQRLVQVNIPEGIRLIGAEAFKNCTSLSKVELPQGLKTINRSCFEGCVKLKDIKLPYSIKRICEGAFLGCELLDPVEIASHVEQIHEKAFDVLEGESAKDLEKEIVQANEYINKEGVLYEVIHLEKANKNSYVRIVGLSDDIVCSDIIIPEKINGYKIEVIRKGAFENNGEITSVILPTSIRVIGANAFRNCTALEFVELPSELETINQFTFEGCKSLDTVVLPYELKTICKGAFKNCIRLKALYHYVKTGIGITMTLDRSLKEYKLPSGLNYIGESAFENCKLISDIYIPYGVKHVYPDTFRNCCSLTRVRLHNKLNGIDSGAFVGCTDLKKLRLPENIDIIGKDSFDECTSIICDVTTANLLKKMCPSNAMTVVSDRPLELSSAMVPDCSEKRFYSDWDLKCAIDMFEIRTPMDITYDREKYEMKSSPSRFSLSEGVYKKKENKNNSEAKILMTGDLMCRPRQMKAAFDGETYFFDDGFQHVKTILKDGDVVIGNMESMVAHSFIYSDEAYFLDDRVHLNAPDAFLSSVKNAGFDVVINAQNHAYDTGVQGIFETLDALNRAQIMHTGMFADINDRRFLLIDVNGIKIGIVSYFDQARQAMKRVNFTKEGLKSLFSNFNEKQIKDDIQAAKKNGAEFIIAYCHCGREYTDQITERQERFMKMVANAGADYIFGSHSHCIQPYSVINTNDKREVPVLYSGGNFFSDMSIKMPYIRDTLISELNLFRDSDGQVKIKSEGYYPCMIKFDKNIRGNMVTVPLSVLLATDDTNVKKEYIEDLHRIQDTVGHIGRYRCLIKEGDNNTDLKCEEVLKYEVSKPVIAKMYNENRKKTFSFNKETGIYEKDNACHDEIKLTLAGQIMYDCSLEEKAKTSNDYNFFPCFTKLNNCFKDSDLSVGNFVAMVSEEAPSMTNNLPSDALKTYCNSRKEFIYALRNAGFDCLAMSSPYNVCTGVSGIIESCNSVQECGIIPSGIGHRKDPIFKIGNIQIAILSYSMDCINRANVITDEGAKKLLNLYDFSSFKEKCNDMKNKGVDFIIAYINCGMTGLQKRYIERKRIAEEIANSGADYIICTVPYIVSKYYRYKTYDNRVVPIATSIGSIISGGTEEPYFLSALIELKLKKMSNGKIQINDDYIPLKIFKNYNGIENVVMPSMLRFNDEYSVKKFSMVQSRLSQKLGELIKMADSKSPAKKNMSSVYSNSKTKISPNVQFVADFKGVSYDQAKIEMDKLKKDYGIYYIEYVDNKLHLCKNEEELQKKIQMIQRSNQKYLKEVCDDTGWSMEKAREEADKIKRKYGMSYRKYSRYRFYEKTPEEVIEQIDKWRNNAAKYERIAMDASGWPEEKVKRHMKRCNAEFDIIPAYYPLYRAWELTDEQLDGYARQRNSLTLDQKYNKQSARRALADKALFNEVYKDYTGRKYWINKDTNFEEFKRFVEGINYIFCKPIESGGGLGAGKYKITEDIKGLYDLLMSKDRLLVEECIEQHDAVDEFAPGCVNTVRVVVLNDKDNKCHIICTGIRFGNGGVTDNFSHDGMVADVDPETGVIRTNAIDKKGHVYEEHPISHKKFIGFQIPHWDQVLKVAKQAMYVQEGINYVGWDVAICKDKVVLVEGNSAPDLVLVQAPYAPQFKGMKYLFEPFF